MVKLGKEIEEKDKSVSEMKTKFVSCPRNYTNDKALKPTTTITTKHHKQENDSEIRK